MMELEDFTTQVLEEQGLVLVDFWAEWCGPCKQMMPALEQLPDDQVKVVKINIDGPHQSLAIEHGVRAVPTLILFKEGQALSRKVGSLSLEALKEWISEFS